MKKKTVLLSSMTILLPMIIGVLFWNQLDGHLIIHFDIYGNPNGVGSKYLFVYGINMIMLCVHLLILIAVRKKKGIVLKVMVWLIPFSNSFTYLILYLYNLKIDINISFLILFIFGVMFMVLGKLMKKVKQNNLFGVRIKWSLESKKNWEYTNRISGDIFFILGVIAVLIGFFTFVIEVKYLILGYGILMILGFIFMIGYAYVFKLKHHNDIDYWEK